MYWAILHSGNANRPFITLAVYPIPADDAPGWVSAVLDLGSNFCAYYSEGHSNPRLDPLVSWCIVQLPSMKPFLGAMANLYHFNHHLEQKDYPHSFHIHQQNKRHWVDWCCISEFNESTFTNRKIFTIIPGLNNPAMLSTHKWKDYNLSKIQSKC